MKTTFRTYDEALEFIRDCFRESLVTLRVHGLEIRTSLPERQPDGMYQVKFDFVEMKR